MFDAQLPQRFACCILDSAVGLLAEQGISEPDRVEFIQHRFDVFPGCCSALLLRDASLTNTTSGDDCGLSTFQIEWQLQYTQCMTVRDPQTGSCNGDSGDCRDVLRCPSDLHTFDMSPCEAATKAEETDMISSARWTLTTGLADSVKACLCDPETAPYPARCVGECGPLSHCEYVRLQSVTAVDGGGCAGFLLRLQTRHHA